jgi:hypothetical protein
MNVRGGFALVASIALVAGCAVATGERAQVPAGPLAPIIGNPGGPPVECRGIGQAKCLELVAAPPGDPARKGVIRLIVTCTSATCAEAEGSFRIDRVEANGRVTLEVDGQYAGMQAEP